MNKSGVKGFTLAIIVIVCAGLFYYMYLTDRSATRQTNKSSTPTEKLLNYNFAEDYPKTVRETVKLHNQYLKYAYNGEFTDEELSTVNRNIRQLLDPDLLAINTEESQLKGLKNEIALYKEQKNRITGYSVAEGSQVNYNVVDDVKYARTRVTVVVNQYSYEQEYVLRQNPEGQWKIMGWQAVNAVDKD